MRPHALLALLALLVSLTPDAQAVPLELPSQGRLLDATGAPLDGPQSVSFALYSSPAGGPGLWTETQTIDFDDGYFSVRLGTVTPIDPSVFDGSTLWMGMTVGSGAELPDRVAVASVPYAIVAGSASSVSPGGSIDTTSLSINGTTLVGPDGKIDWSSIKNAPTGGDGDSDTLAGLSCLPDQLVAYDGSEWACADAGDHAHDAADITSGTVSITRLPVGTGGSEVAAGDHEHTAFTGGLTLGAGITLGDTGADCDETTAGTLRFDGIAFQACTGKSWVILAAVDDGGTKASAARSCKTLLAGHPSKGDGVYWLDPDGPGGVDAFQGWCDMTTDGGGWTLVGTVSGNDGHSWNTQYGYWSDERTLGSTSSPWKDFKSQAWNTLDVSDAEVLFQRRYDGSVRGQAILSNACLFGVKNFRDLFATNDTSLRCQRSEITVLKGDAAGTSSSSYVEGGTDGIGGSRTNGFCWNGGDNQSNTFRGHAGWNQDSYSTCVANGHLGYIGVWQAGDPQYTVADITGTNWLYGTNYALTEVSFFVR